MARIQDYGAQVSANAPLPGRSPERLYAEPEDFGSGAGLITAGRGLDSAGSTLYDAAQRDETTSVATSLAQLRSKWTIELQKRANTSAVDDPNFVQNFSDEFQNDIAQYGGNLNTAAGQVAFKRGSAELTATMLGNANATAVHAASARNVNSFLTMQNANVDTLNRDPTQLQSILADTDATLNDPNSVYGQMPAEKRNELGLQAKEQYALAAARATITQNPLAGQQMLKDGTLPGQQFIKGQASLYLSSFADSAVNAMRIKRMQADADAERQRRLGAEDAGRSIFDSFLKNPGDTTLSDKVINDPNMRWEEKASLLNAMGRSAKPLADHDLNTYGDGFYDFYHAVGQGKDFSLEQLADAVGPRPDGSDGPLTAAGVDKIMALQQSKRTPEGAAEAQMLTTALAGAKAELTYRNPMLPGQDPKGQQAYAMFMQKFLPAFDAAKADGKTPVQELLDFKNPKSLISTTMATYNRSLQDKIADWRAEFTPSGAGALPKAGDVVKGYEFLGGDPADQKNWKAQ